MSPTFLSLWIALSLLSERLPTFELLANDESILKKADLGTDSASLLAFLQKRSLSDEERPRVKALIQQLGSQVYREREQALSELTRRGPVVAEMLREATKSDDLEIARRAEKILARIKEQDVPVKALPAAVRLLAHRRPTEAVATLLAYLPFADNDAVAEEVRAALLRLSSDNGKPHPILVAGLTDKLPFRRAASGEALCKLPGQETAVRKLLADTDAFVRLRVALALTYARDKEAVPVLIDALPQVPAHHAWQAEEVLYRLAEDKSPPGVVLGNDEAGRKKFRDAWQAWWKENGAGIDLAKLREAPTLHGYTIVVLLEIGRIMELGPQNQVRWQIDNLIFPLDIQYLPEGRILIAEYHAGRVTERTIKGEILWQKRFTNAQVAQRLQSGNTFMCSDTRLLEIDMNGTEVFGFTMPNGERIMKAMKLPSGEIACLTDAARIVRFDTTGKELHSFPVPIGTRLFGGRIHMLPSGRVLVPHNGENKVVEYDARGKPVWEINVIQPVAAVRLPNGNTLVTSFLNDRGAVEYNRLGQEVWSYRTNTKVTRAIRR
ncbi:MAG: PQQ-binding-like beta-propeller repeat protein [Planctomycetes bacterium]|nr:PQQ-binding-like beta-propeller repeat protein [Planctomycetota bacterium]